jgi:polysaccharide pyruvyl transferase WcaK-like protein
MEQTRKQIALLHHTGCGNLGDDAIIDAVVSNIRRRWDNAEIKVFSMNPDDTAKRHGIPSYPIRRYRWDIGHRSATIESTQPGGNKLRNWFRKTRNPAVRLPRAAFGELAFLVESYRILRSFDLLIVSGGGQLTERGGPWSFPYALFIWSLVAKKAGVRFVLLNVGAGPLNHPLSRFFVARALRAANYVSFRDQQSQELATDLEFTDRGYVFPDNAYSFEVVSPNVSAKDPNQSVVGVAPMPYPFSDLLKHPSNAQAIQDDLIGRMATFASLLVRESYSIELFGSDTRADPSAIEDLRKVLLSHHHISTPEYIPLESVSELLSRMSAMDYVVTCRFHGVLFAHLLNKPVLAIAHHPKVTNLMNALGLSTYCVDMRTFDPIRLMDTFTSLVSDAEAVKRSMAASLASYRSQLAIQFDSLFPPSPQAKIEAAGDTYPSVRNGLLQREAALKRIKS